MTSTPELAKLQQSVRESRLLISKEYAGLLSDLDIRKRFTESVRQHPMGWIGGAATAGLLATFFGGRKNKTVHPRSVSATTITPNAAPSVEAGLSKAGWIAGALEVGKFLFPLLRPVVVEMVTKAAQAGLAKRR